MPVQKYRKKPIVIEAIQFLGDNNPENEEEILEFTGNQFYIVEEEDRLDDPDIHAVVFDYLHSTWVGVKVGDYILKGIKGEFYPHDGDLFPEVYEEV